MTRWVTLPAISIAIALSVPLEERVGGQAPSTPVGSITGRVTDERGVPIDRASVQATVRLPDGSLDYAGSAATSADGIYVIERVPTGPVIVGVTVSTFSARLPTGQTVAPRVIPPSRGSATVVIDRDGRTFEAITGPTWIDDGRTVPYSTTYFGGSRTMSGAKPVDIVENQRTTGIDLRLIRARTFRVAGEVIGSMGPIQGAEVRLFAQGPVFDVFNFFGAPMTALAYSDEQGRFTFLSVPDGSYSVTVAGRQSFAVRVNAEGVPLISTSDVISNTLREALPETTLVVGSADLTDVRLVLQRKVAVHGTVVAPRARPAMTPIRPVVQLRLGTEGTPIRVPGLMPFRIDVIPGKHQFRLLNVPGSWSVMSVTLNGRNVTGQPIEVGPDGLDGLHVTIGDPALDVGPFVVSGPPTRVVIGPNGAALPSGAVLPPGAVRVPAPLGTVSGTVSDAGGRPIAGLSVRVFRMFVRNGIEEAGVIGNGAVTDNNGRYRIEGIPRGTTYVAAMYPPLLGPPSNTPPTAHLPSAVDQDGIRRGYVTTYYPGVTRRPDAQSVVVLQNEELSGIDIALPRVPLVDIPGIVENVTGRGIVRVLPASPHEQLGGVLRIAEIAPDGSFRAVDLPHGEYVLMSTVATTWARATVTVNGPVASSVRLTMRPSYAVSGRLVIEPPDDPSAAAPPAGTIRLQLEGQPRSAVLTAAVMPSGEFTFRNVPGGHYILLALSSGGTWIQRTGIINGQNSLVRPVEISGDVSDASVVIASRPTLR